MAEAIAIDQTEFADFTVIRPSTADITIIDIPITVEVDGEEERASRPHAFAGVDSREPYPKLSTVSLVKRFSPVLPDLKDGSTIVSLGIEGEDAEIVLKKYGQEMQRRDISYIQAESVTDPLPYANRSVAAVIGNISENENLPNTLAELNRIVQPEGALILNIHDVSETFAEFESDPLLDNQLYDAGLHVKGTPIEHSGKVSWRAVDASTMPEIMPSLAIDSQTWRREKIYGGADLDFYK